LPAPRWMSALIRLRRTANLPDKPFDGCLEHGLCRAKKPKRNEAGGIRCSDIGGGPAPATVSCLTHLRRKTNMLKRSLNFDLSNANNCRRLIDRANPSASLLAVSPHRIAARTMALVVKKLLSTAPMLMYQHSFSGVSMPGK